nr:hypothetical protein [Tanacetum cinerariifolium]
MPLRANLSFVGLDNFVFKSKVSKTITSVPKVETKASKTSKDSLEKPKTIRSSAPIIEDWESDSEDENVFEPKVVKKTIKPSLEKIEFVNARNTTVENENKAKKPKKFSQSPRVNNKGKITGPKEIRPVWDNTAKGNPQYALQDQGIFDSGSSRHKTGNKSYLTDYQEINCGFVAFGGNAKGGKITGKGEAANTNSTNRLNTVSSPVNTVCSSFTTVDQGRERAQRNEFESVFGQDKDANGNMMFTPVSAAGSTYVHLSGSIPVNAATLPNADLPIDPLMPDLEDTTDLHDFGIFSGTYDDEVAGAKADFNNLELTTDVSPFPTTKIHKDHPKEQIIGDPLLALQTRRTTKNSQEQAVILVTV